MDSEGNVVEFKKRGMYFFVHDKELRNCYDTYKVIERFRSVGFQERSQEITNSNTTVLIAGKDKRKK